MEIRPSANETEKSLKEATVNSFTYTTHQQLKEHLNAYLLAYNFAKRLKILKGKSPWKFILNEWKEHSEYFHADPNQFYMGLNSSGLDTRSGWTDIFQEWL